MLDPTTQASSDSTLPSNDTSSKESLEHPEDADLDTAYLERHWAQVSDFISKSKESDPFVYALTRKEAYLQKCWTHRTREQTTIFELWHLKALKYIMGGRLLFSPKFFNADKTSVLDNTLVLDIQGAYGSILAWHAALDFPNALFYGFKVMNDTVLNAEVKIRPVNVPKITIAPNKRTPGCSAGKNANTKGPPRNRDAFESASDHANFSQTKNEGPTNFIPCSGHSLKSLPFDDNTFDVIRLGGFWYLALKKDWDEVFLELLRITKPGGFIEIISFEIFPLNDNNFSHPLWVRLAACLENAGYETHPGIKLPHSLYKAGFENVHKTSITFPWGWGGHMSHMSDFISLYQGECLFKAFLDVSAEEFEAFVKTALSKNGPELRAANNSMLLYANKPECSKKNS